MRASEHDMEPKHTHTHTHTRTRARARAHAHTHTRTRIKHIRHLVTQKDWRHSGTQFHVGLEVFGAP
jgi:hypothetical protein